MACVARPLAHVPLERRFQESNALGGIAMNQIKLPTGIYKLELGALKILDNLVLDGDGADFTTIDGQ